jgi:hypothetical protein
VRYALIFWVALATFFSLRRPAAPVNAPVLFFSDLTSGGRTGLTDASVTNQGAIVTVWGTGLASSQGASTISVGSPASGWVPAAHVYYWQNATGSKPGGPADLFTKQKIQEVAFSIASTTPVGNQYIKVTTGGVDSNLLPFTVAKSGSFFFVKPSTGSDNIFCGSWTMPCASFNYVVHKGFTIGSVIYSAEDITMNNSSGPDVSIDDDGTPAAHKALIAYPNTLVNLTTGNANNAVQSFTSGTNDRSAYWTIAKINTKTDGLAINLGIGSRISTVRLRINK